MENLPISKQTILFIVLVTDTVIFLVTEDGYPAKSILLEYLIFKKYLILVIGMFFIKTTYHNSIYVVS